MSAVDELRDAINETKALTLFDLLWMVARALVEVSDGLSDVEAQLSAIAEEIRG